MVGFGMIVIGALLGAFVLDPVSSQAAEAVESGDGARIRAVASRLSAWGVADTLLLLFTITVMVIRWD